MAEAPLRTASSVRDGSNVGGTAIERQAFHPPRASLLHERDRQGYDDRFAIRPTGSPDLRERRISVEKYLAMGEAGILSEDNRIRYRRGASLTVSKVPEMEAVPVDGILP